MRRKTLVGIDIGQSRVKIALVSSGVVKKVVSAELPENVFREGKIENTDKVAEVIRETLRAAHIRPGYAALAISSESAYIKHIEIPMMTQDQLKKNLPYEFSDFIEGDPGDYVYDYITVEIPDDDLAAQPEEETAEQTGEGEGEVELTPVVEPPVFPEEEEEKYLKLLGVCSSKTFLNSMEEMMRKAGLKLIVVAPELSAYAALIALRGGGVQIPSGEYAFVDIGYRCIKLFMFKYDTFMASRELEWGISDVIAALAEEMGVDNSTARVYLERNYADCQNSEAAKNRFDLISVELKRSLDFYSFSNPDSQLQDLWIVGGGSYIAPLQEQITAALEEFVIHSTDELLPELLDERAGDLYLKAAGIAMNQ